MQPQDIEKAVKELNQRNKNADILAIIDGIKIYMPCFELHLVDGAIMLHILSDGGKKLFGIFDTRSVAGIIDGNVK